MTTSSPPTEADAGTAVPPSMLNPLSIYEDAGRKAGIASRRRDTSTAEFHSSWMRRAIALEPEVHRAAARKAFDDAYRAEATPPMTLG